jgi:hypothetical protein
MRFPPLQGAGLAGKRQPDKVSHAGQRRTAITMTVMTKDWCTATVGPAAVNPDDYHGS